jgi:3-hydroxyisobutyrate dehydrogenase
MLQCGILQAILPEGICSETGRIGVEAIDHLAARSRSGGPTLQSQTRLSRTPASRRAMGSSILACGPHRARAFAPLFQGLGQRVLWLGRVGLGTRLKLVLDTWLAKSTWSARARHRGIASAFPARRC